MQRLMEDHGDLSAEDKAWLMRLVGEWQLVADLSFSDLVLWIRDEDPHVFWAVAQVRPTTGPTALEEDVVGDNIAYNSDHGVAVAYLSGSTVRASDHQLQLGIPAGVSAIPIRRNGQVIAVVERHTNQFGVRAPGSLEDNYLQISEQLASMLANGEYPPEGEPSHPERSPSVGDGLIRLDAHGDVMYATPNAVSAYRRMGLVGDLEDENLTMLTLAVMAPAGAGGDPEELRALIGSSTAREMMISVGMISIRMRILPLHSALWPGETLVLIRDVTELNKRERALVTKDATIREIHHRVKNNLQTVAALLRMQARRIDSPEGKAALTEAVSRVSAIAVVHETLSQAFDEVVEFDGVADRVLQMVSSVAGLSRSRARREGTFGLVPAENATSLSLVMTELFQNAFEHGLAGQSTGTVRVRPLAEPGRLTVDVVDDGAGLAEGFSLEKSPSLGLSIVKTLMADLGGTFELTNNPDGPGARARIRMPMRDPHEASPDPEYSLAPQG